MSVLDKLLQSLFMTEILRKNIKQNFMVPMLCHTCPTLQAAGGREKIAHDDSTDLKNNLDNLNSNNQKYSIADTGLLIWRCLL